jgi:hypothetical protein
LILLDKERVNGREVKRKEVDNVKTTDGAERVNSLRSVSFRNNYFEEKLILFCELKVSVERRSRRKRRLPITDDFGASVLFFGISNFGRERTNGGALVKGTYW